MERSACAKALPEWILFKKNLSWLECETTAQRLSLDLAKDRTASSEYLSTAVCHNGEALLVVPSFGLWMAIE